LEKVVASCNGRPIPIRTFSYQQLILATNSFDHRLILHADQGYEFYKGSFEGRILSIKSYKQVPMKDLAVGSIAISSKDLALTDIAISAKLSAHKNILRLAGCCLETSTPTLVYEYAQNGVLADQIDISRRQGMSMVWHSRLKIARQIAYAISYLHTAFSRPIVHRHIKLENIFLDHDDVPKLCDFSHSISIPEGEIHVVVDRVIGSLGSLCPRYMATSIVTEKTDVYSFGMVLLQLLTGQDSYRLCKLAGNDFKSEKLLGYLRKHGGKIMDPAILGEGGGTGVEQQLQAVLQLAFTCIEGDPDVRPTMVDVTKELRSIEKFIV
jgi:serine/threonine protein kinase